LFNVNWTVYLLSYGYVIGAALFPTWFFQGIEQMRYITIIQVIVRSILIALIFLLIKEEGDYIILVLLYSTTHIVIGILGLIVARFKFLIKFKVPRLNDIKTQLKSGWNIFLSMISINIYTTSNTFILGLFASETVVGYYAAADKLRLAFQGIQSVISQSVFPYVNKLAKESKARLLNFNKQLLKLEGGISLFISVILFLFAHQLAELVFGPEFLLSGKILRILSILPFVISLSNVFGIQTMIPLGFEKSFNFIISIAAILHILLLLVLIPLYLAEGTALAVSITELLISLMMFLFLIKKNIRIFANV
jgi:PST family polysaccharide transporter